MIKVCFIKNMESGFYLCNITYLNEGNHTGYEN